MGRVFLVVIGCVHTPQGRRAFEWGNRQLGTCHNVTARNSPVVKHTRRAALSVAIRDCTGASSLNFAQANEFQSLFTSKSESPSPVVSDGSRPSPSCLPS